MYSKILVPMALDHDISPQTLEVARALGAPGCEITALHVHEDVQGTARAYMDDSVIQQGIDRAKATLEKKTAGLENVTAKMITGHSARSIIDYVNSHDVDCVVMGSHKPGLSDYFLGSTAARVVRHAKCAVHVHRTR